MNPRFLIASLVVALGGCAVGPTYDKPKVDVPPQYKELGDWVPAKPRDDVPKGKWWEVFADPDLNQLAEQVSVSNQSLAATEARYRQARAAVAAARSQLFPTIGASSDASRSRRGGTSSGNAFSLGLDARWEADLWGSIRRQVEAARAGVQASAADLEGARLSLQAELATDYFQLRVTDVQRDLYADTLQAFQRSLDIANNRYKAGVSAKVDVVEAESQLRSAQAQALDLEVTRAQLEHAIALLVGKPASGFSIASRRFDARIPEIPPGVPSTLLERRPDIAAAERRTAAANERIGVAQAAFYPNLSLTGSAGFSGSSLAHLISAPNRFWSLGVDLADTLLDFGARSAQVETARGVYDEAVANYRQTVLGAFQDVENSLATIRWLAKEGEVQQEAARLARESVVLTVNQYKAGTVSYLNVVTVQQNQLSEERQAVALLGRRLTATVALIRGIGGHWEP